ncbi:MAG: PP2C family protein-serine/threonine phosphatase [Chitinophagaceae bacterium]
MAEKYFGITDKGVTRNNNEDTFIAEAVMKDKFICACVIDGVGGYEGGEIAAAIARETILKYFTVPSGQLSSMMREAIISANEKIYNEKLSSRQYENMACVLTLALIEKEKNRFYYAHVGDTRLYLLRDHSLVKVTNDHSFVGYLEDSGRLNESEAMSHPKRNEINKALGFDKTIPNPAEYIETGESPFLPGDTLLLCTDGLTDMINKAGITNFLSQSNPLEEKAKQLVDAANNAGGKDNITVVLVENNHKRIKQKATKPVTLIKKKDQQKDEYELNKSFESRAQVTTSKKTTSNNVNLLLLLLFLISTSGFIWLWFNKKEEVTTQPVVFDHQLYPEEKILRDSLNNLTGYNFYITPTVFGDTIFLSQPLIIDTDSLHLKGSANTVFTIDSLYNSGVPAIQIAPWVKFIFFDSIQFYNMDVGIQSDNTDALHFNHVGFQNAFLQVKQTPGGKSFTGSALEMQLLKKDSLVKITKE